MYLIEWYYDDGCMGGSRGLSFNTKTKIITKWNGEQELLSAENINDVQWCIDMNINALKDRIVEINTKLNQTKCEYTKIDGGYRISNPLTVRQKASMLDKLKEVTLEYEWLKSFSLTIE